VLLVLGALALSGLIVYGLVALSFPDWRPSFLGGNPEEVLLPGRSALPSPPSAAVLPGPEPAAPTDTAASRMLFGGSGSAVLGDRVPEASHRSANPADPAGPRMAGPRTTLPETPSPAARMAFQRYAEWLRQVELERLRLRNWGEEHLPEVVAATPGSPERKQTVREALAEVRAFSQRVVRTKPVVPADCRIVDQYYMGALDREAAGAAALVEALEAGNEDESRRLQKAAIGAVDRDLTVANAKLEQTFRKRGEPVTLHLETGAAASLLGVLP
jgi:hypothetical protein